VAHTVTASAEVDRKVAERVLQLGAIGENTNRITRQTLICQQMWRDIKSRLFRVITPMADKIIEFTSYDNRRNVSLFLDLVRGHAVINYKQRRQEEGADGIPVLYAEYEDYLVAATVFNAQSQYLGSRLTKDEYEAVNFIYQCPGVSINEILLHMQEFNPTGRWNSQKLEG